ncbi:MAG: nucleotidyl transferase AbiEii/AbiGii toxin family protein [Sedimentisphaerales bacterium]
MIQKLIKEIAESLDEERIPYMIIGGQAVLIYGRPRLTRDIDITLGIDADDFALVEKTCKKLKLKMLHENPKNFAKETNVLPAEEPTSGIRIDFIFSFSPYETKAIKRAKEIIIDNYPVKFASCEDVIIHKMVAARAIDAEDVKSILIKNKDSIDLEYITGWLLEFSKISENEGILEGFNRLLK